MLFESQIPLAERMRPNTIDDIVGQEHITGKGSILRTSLENGSIPSMILWGPPGVGKTTLANVITQTLRAPYFQLSAISSGVKEVREVIEQAKELQRAVLFIDEIHRFNKSQQDALLGAVEKGTIRLIGATTENPSFEVNAALLSRCQVYVLKPLSDEDLLQLAQRVVLVDTELKKRVVVFDETQSLLRYAGGDARKLLNIIELVCNAVVEEKVVITNELVTHSLQQNPMAYDKDGELHYDIISAFIKSIRGSDPDAAVY